MKRVPPFAELGSHSDSDDEKVVPFRVKGVPAPRPEMSVSDKLDALFGRLTTRQRKLILAAAETDRPTPRSVIRQIAELESAIAAVATLWGEGEVTQR